MTQLDVSIPPRRLPPRQLSPRIWIVFLAIQAVIAVVVFRLVVGADDVGRASWTPQAPDVGLLFAAGPLIVLHVATVLGAFVVGVVLLVGAKGRRLHRILGWTWIALMLTTAVTTLFIQSDGGFSAVHTFSVITLIEAPLGVVLARLHWGRAHGLTMASLFFGALVIAGAVAFMPPRLMHGVVFG